MQEQLVSVSRPVFANAQIKHTFSLVFSLYDRGRLYLCSGVGRARNWSVLHALKNLVDCLLVASGHNSYTSKWKWDVPIDLTFPWKTKQNKPNQKVAGGCESCSLYRTNFNFTSNATCQLPPAPASHTLKTIDILQRQIQKQPIGAVEIYSRHLGPVIRCLKSQRIMFNPNSKYLIDIFFLNAFFSSANVKHRSKREAMCCF